MVKKTNGYWNYETCYEEAQKYFSRSEFREKNQYAYNVALKNGWVEKYTWLQRPKNWNFVWDYKKCYTEAQKYKSKKEFNEKSNGAYTSARNNGWLKDYTWFERPVSVKKWNYENCYNLAKTCGSKSEFKSKSNAAYNSSRKNGWLNDYIWFEEKHKPNGYWTYEMCYEEAQKYKNKPDFRKNNSAAFSIARKNGWLSDYIWLEELAKPNGYWTYETCFEEAKKYTTRIEFSRKSSGAYDVVLKNGWLDDYTWLEYTRMPKEYRFNLLKEFIDEYELRAFLENNDENILYIILRNVEPKYEPLVDEVEKIIRNSNGSDPMKALIDKYIQDETAEDVNKDNETSNDAHEEIHGINDIDLDDDEAVKEVLKQEEKKKEVSIDDVVKNTEKELEVINKIEHLLTPEDREYIMDKFLNDKLREYMAKKDAQK